MVREAHSADCTTVRDWTRDAWRSARVRHSVGPDPNSLRCRYRRHGEGGRRSLSDKRGWRCGGAIGMRDRLAGRKSHADRVARDGSRDRGCRRRMRPSAAVGKGFRLDPLSAIIVPAQRQMRRVGLGVRVNMRVDAIGFSGLGLGRIGVAPGRPPLCHGRLCCRDLPWLPPLCPPAPPDDRISPALLRQRRLAAPSPKRPPTNKERTSGTRLSPSTTSLRHATRPPRERTAASRRVRGTSSATPARPRAT